jgi:hypothetical protein
MITSLNVRWMLPTASPVFAGPLVARASSTDRTTTSSTWITTVFNYAYAITVALLRFFNNTERMSFWVGAKARVIWTRLHSPALHILHISQDGPTMYY